MKRVFIAPFVNSEKGKFIRMAFLTTLIIYVMIMVFILPTISAAAEATAAKQDEQANTSQELPSTEESSNTVSLPELIEEEIPTEDTYLYESLPDDLIKSKKAKIVGEVESKRDAYTKHYLMTDGSYKMVQYSSPVHYLNEENIFEEIDNNLTLVQENGAEVSKNNANFYKVKFFNDKADNEAMQIEQDKYKLSWSLITSQTKIDKSLTNIINDTKTVHKSGKLERFNVADGIDINYSVFSNTIKEDIVIKKPLSDYTIRYDIKSENLNLLLTEEGSISAKSAFTDEPVMDIPAAFMYDADGNHSYNVSYKLFEKGNGEYTLIMTPDKKWIEACDRKFPITIDPDVIFDTSTNIFSRCETYSSNSEYRNISDGEYTAMKFTLNTLPATATVTSANLKLTISQTSISAQYYVFASEADEVWYTPTVDIELAIGSSLDRLLQILLAPYANALLEVGAGIKVANLDISSLVKKWVETTETQKGLLLYSLQTNSPASSELFRICSEYNSITERRPVLTINYRENIGYEQYWDYDNISAGTAGTVLINNYNNQLFLMHNDVTLAGALPISLSHIYNDAWTTSSAPSSLNNYNIGSLYDNMRVGIGWKLNYQQAIVPIETYTSLPLDSKYKYVYIDGDGTPHFIIGTPVEAPTNYVDEDGLGFTLTIDTSSTTARYILTDLGKNKLEFESSGRLKKIVDKNGNFNELTYNGNKISSITDTDGRAVQLQYNSANYLIAINYDYDGTKYKRHMNIQYAGLMPYRFLDTYTDENNQTSNVSYAFYMYTNSTYGKLSDTYSKDGYTLHFSTATRSLEYDTVNVRTIEEKATQINDINNGPYSVTPTLLSTGQKRELVFYYGKTVSVSPAADADFYEYGTSNYDNNIFTTKVFDQYGRVVSNYYSLDDTLVSNSYRYDGQTIATAEMTGSCVSGVGDISERADDKNKVTSNSYFSSNTHNYLVNGSFENYLNGWTTEASVSPPVGKVTYTSAYSKVNGNYACFIYLPQVVTMTLGAKQDITLEAGTYVFSGYAKIAAGLLKRGTWDLFGAYLRIIANGNTYYSDCINYEPLKVNNGYRLLSVSFTLTETTTISAAVMLGNCAATAIFDGMQLVKGKVASTNAYNCIVNGDFETGNLNNWTYYSENDDNYPSVISTDTDYYEDGFDDYMLQIVSIAGAYNGVYQDINAVAMRNNSYVLSVWSLCAGIVAKFSDDSFYGIAVEFFNNATNIGTTAMPFNPRVIYWQQAILPFRVPANATKIRIHIVFDGCTLGAFFDNVSVVSASTQNYSYDENGLLKDKVDGAGNEYYTNEEIIGNTQTFSYKQVVGENDTDEGVTETNDRLINVTTRNADNYNVISSVNNLANIKSSYVYDTAGRVTENVVSNNSGTIYNIVTTTSYVDLNANYKNIITNTDSKGFITISTYDGMMGLLEGTTASNVQYSTANYQYTTHEYYANMQLKRVTVSGSCSYNSSGGVVNYTYDSKDRLLSIIYGQDINNPEATYSYTYDNWGNILTVSVNGITLVTKTYLNNGLMASKQLGNGYTEYYTYDSLGRLINVAIGSSSTIKYRWYYSPDGVLQEYNDSNVGNRYEYQYDNLGRIIAVALTESGDNIPRLIDTYSYDNYNRLTSTYSYIRKAIEPVYLNTPETDFNTYTPSFYTSGGNLQTISMNSTTKVNYYYTNGLLTRENNKLITYSTTPDGITIIYNRDSNGILISKTVYKYTAGTTAVSEDDEILDLSGQYQAHKFTYYYQYSNDSDETLSSMTLSDGYTYKYNYDALKRVSSEQIKNGSTVILSEAYTYKYGREDTSYSNARTYLVNSKTVGDHTYTYSYNFEGKITYINDLTISTNTTLYTKYYYNNHGQLYREDNPYVDATIVYIYDGNNNLLYKRNYAYTYNSSTLPGTYTQIAYTYGNATWGDLLTNYNGSSISYNAIGQPTSYMGDALTWNCTNLASHFNNGSVFSRVTYNFYYDADGYRTEKKRTSGLFNSKTYTYYYWDNGVLEKEKRGNLDMWFIYNDTGKIIGLDYESTRYYYVKDAFDNVIGIIDNTGTLVVSYTYDSWGKILSTTGSLASSVGANNPFRYRSYYYDIDIGMYYLISRYYDPNTGRFISPDSILSDSSLFAYCGNDPVNYTDDGGMKKQLNKIFIINNSTSLTSFTRKTYGGVFHEKGIGPSNSVDIGFLYYNFALLESNKLIGGTIGMVYFEHNPMFTDNFGMYWGIAVLTADAYITYAGFELKGNIWSISCGLDIYDVKVGLTIYFGVGLTVDLSNGVKIGYALGVGGEVDIRFSWIDLWEKITGGN